MRRFQLPDEDAFNGTFVETEAGKLLIYRTEKSCSAVFLDNELRYIPGTHQKLDLWKNVDPRVICHDGRIYLSTSYFGGGYDRERIELRRVIREGAEIGFKLIGKFEMIEGDPSYQKTREKSWVPFAHDGRLLYVHKVRPHRILEVDIERGAVKLIYETTWDIPDFWKDSWGSDLRLNAPPVRINEDSYLSTFHTYHAGGYRTWFYTFSAKPPFEVTGVGGEPAVLPGDGVGKNPYSSRHRCVFLTGMHFDSDNDRILLTGGNNDAAVVSVELSGGDIVGNIAPVRQIAMGEGDVRQSGGSTLQGEALSEGEGRHGIALPLLSIVIPVKGRLRDIKRTLERTVSQVNSEVIVVDYCCPDATSEWVQSEFPQVKVVHGGSPDKFSVSDARNIGAAAASGEWLMFLDSDIMLNQDAVARLMQNVASNRFYLAAPRNYGFGGWIMVERELYFKAGGYDTRFVGYGIEDDDLIMSLMDLGIEGSSIPLRSIGGHLEHSDDDRLRFYGQESLRRAMSENRARFVEKWGRPVSETVHARKWPVVTI